MHPYKYFEHLLNMRYNYRIKLNHMLKYGTPTRPFLIDDIKCSILLIHKEINLLKIKYNFPLCRKV